MTPHETQHRQGPLARRSYLWEVCPYFRQMAGQLVLGSMMGILMNAAIMLPTTLLGRASDAARAFARDNVGASAMGWVAQT